MTTKSLNIQEEIGTLADRVGGVYKLSYRLGLTPTSIYRLINGTSKPNYDTLVKLSDLTEELAEVENADIQT
tara:strand:+ start:177 stop:392 length:216 start_codon:yes stop_codon:yes gene_type:complete